MEMLRKGASLDEIGDVLRHRSRMTTTIYARHDIEALRSIARRWPVGGDAQVISLTAHLNEYIATGRGLGYDLSFSERVLRRFAEFADREDTDHITVDLFLRWKNHYGSANNNTWSARLSMVRVFGGWLQGFDPRNEVPPPGLISGKPRRTRPYIYTDDQIARIVAEAQRLPSSYGLARLDLFDSVRVDRCAAGCALTKPSGSTKRRSISSKPC